MLSTVLAASLAFWAAPPLPTAYADTAARASEQSVGAQETPAEHHSANEQQQQTTSQTSDGESTANATASAPEESPAATAPLPQAAIETAATAAYAHTATASQNGRRLDGK